VPVVDFDLFLEVLLLKPLSLFLLIVEFGSVILFGGGFSGGVFYNEINR
jgi:hypothetical protein